MRPPSLQPLAKTPTGITGLDEITLGGLPTGRPTLICGYAGCGKTLFGLEFLVRGAQQYNEPGVLIAFEEKPEELATNVASLGFDLEKLQKQKKIRIDYIHVDRTEIEETGEYDLEGLFIRLSYAIDSIGAKRVVLDTIENLFAGLSNLGILRAELRRLFTFLKEKGVTAVITGERGEKTLTRQGLEEYVSDCVILLDNRISDQISTRRLRIVKYRGTLHGGNEYPFLIDEEGISVLPVTSLTLDRPVSSSIVSSGLDALDQMLSFGGFYQGSSILVSGTAGTGKSSIAATFIDAACSRGEKALFFAFEESPEQIKRNMASIGLDLGRHSDKGLLKFYASRPSLYGLEMHLVAIHKAIRKFRPSVVVLDPVTNLSTVGTNGEVKSMLVRLIDFLQAEQITVIFTSLAFSTETTTDTDQGLSSLVDVWILIKDIEMNGERNRGLYVIKSRGMKHSSQVREFVITDQGLDLIDVYVGPQGVLTGSARQEHELARETGVLLHTDAMDRKDRELVRKKKLLETRIENLRTEFESTEEELNKVYVEDEIRKQAADKTRQKLTDMRNKKSKDTTKPTPIAKKKK